MRMMSLGEWRPVAAAARLSAQCVKGKRCGFPIEPRRVIAGQRRTKASPTLLARYEKRQNWPFTKSARHRRNIERSAIRPNRRGLDRDTRRAVA
jgi:hypothetical protein